MTNQGKLYLVGAGPGDAGLLTVKALETIKKADVVVYDRLVSPNIMDTIPEGAELINVGKNVGDHPVPQERINEILFEEVQKGKTVVRLKGGDSFVFGRGGEELEKIAEHNLNFEVIPGIVSGISVPCYAGIPVTHRDYCSSLHLITGHARKGGELNIDFDAIKRLNGTLIFMMSVGTIGKIADGLIAAGMDINMPCAVIENGTYTYQRKFVSDLANIAQVVKQNKVISPAIIVVGKVCALSNSFDWFSNQPLKNKQILITRPKAGASKLAKELKAAGAGVTEYPCIKTTEMQVSIPDISDYNTIVFTSAVGVNAFFKSLFNDKKDVRSLYNKRFAVIGSETGAELLKYGIVADFTPSIFEGEVLAKEMIASGFVTKTDKLFVPRVKVGAPEITTVLAENDIEFLDYPVYETNFVANKAINVQEYDYVTFTSKSCVDGFKACVGNEDFSGVKAICIGTKTAKCAKAIGFETITSEVATIKSMVEKILSL